MRLLRLVLPMLCLAMCSARGGEIPQPHKGNFYTAEGSSSFSKDCSDWSYQSWGSVLKEKAIADACENAKELCYGDYSSSHPDKTFFCEPVTKNSDGFVVGGAHGSDGDCGSGAYTEAEVDATCTVEVIFTRPE
jgi:hypothetical protein